jgi:hypothetical protein
MGEVKRRSQRVQRFKDKSSMQMQEMRREQAERGEGDSDQHQQA